MKIVACALIACALAVSGPVSAGAAQEQQDVQIQVIELTPSVRMLMGRGGNIGVSSGEDGVFLIDDQFAPLTEKILEAIGSFSDQPVKFVINTHWHGDHTGGNENLGKAGAIIVAHENVYKRLSTDQVLVAFDREIPARQKEALPVITFTRDLTFHLNGDELKVFHVENAHTDGDAIIYFTNANAVHMGDTFFNGMYPFIDTEHGGSIDGMIAAAGRMLEMIDDDTKIIPGHGPLGARAQLQAYHDMLVGVREAIQAEVAAGKSVDEVVAANPTAAYDGEWGGGFLNPERFTRIVAGDLSSR